MTVGENLFYLTLFAIVYHNRPHGYCDRHHCNSIAAIVFGISIFT